MLMELTYLVDSMSEMAKVLMECAPAYTSCSDLSSLNLLSYQPRVSCDNFICSALPLSSSHPPRHHVRPLLSPQHHTYSFRQRRRRQIQRDSPTRPLPLPPRLLSRRSRHRPHRPFNPPSVWYRRCKSPSSTWWLAARARSRLYYYLNNNYYSIWPR